MIVTVTLNAALDVVWAAAGLSWQSTRDVAEVRHRAGGRGVAVARILHTFGHEVVAAGLAGGATGELIKEDLRRSGIPVAFTEIGGESRRVLEVTDTTDGRMIRLREPGPYVTTEELGRFAGDYRRMLADATAVVLCGTVPAGLPPEIYGSLATWAAEAGVPVILNAGGSALRYAAARRPDLVIPDADDRGAGDLGGSGVTAGDDGALSVHAALRDAGAREVAWADEVAVNSGAAGDQAAGPAGGGRAAAGGGRAAGEGRAAAGGGRAAGKGRAAGEGRTAEGDAIAEDGTGEALLGLGAAAVATPGGGRVRVVTKAGRWAASLPSSAPGGTWETAPTSLGALVAGLVPGFLLGWSWPDLLRHAVAVTAAASTSGKVDLAVYERLLDTVTVDPAG